VIIDRIKPDIDQGRFASKIYLDEKIKLTAHVLVDGHDLPKARVTIRQHTTNEAVTFTLINTGNDEWSVDFQPPALGLYSFVVEAALDRYGTWEYDLEKRKAAGQDVRIDLQIGEDLRPTKDEFGLDSVVKSHVGYFRVLPSRARFSSWYEFFPRSVTATTKLHHGTLTEAIERLPYIKKMGFDIVYLPPIHPIGSSFKKGKNNSLETTPEDVGSPWAIGNKEGGHKSILPALGTLADFKKLIQAVEKQKMQLAMDLAYQCSPEHPYVKEHPEWFKKRPDGTIQYAENPPKKYQDIYPFDFESSDWQALWKELKSVVDFWIDQGVRIFRVDNPHTKSFHFWEWMIGSVLEEHPDVIFLSEAFTRPKLMAYLAKAGFSQSYTYFTWRNVKWEITQYMTELTQSELSDFFMPNFWPNTPDILPYNLQKPNSAMFKQRLILAATLSSSYGIYGPAFELMVSAPKTPGEEYLNSEKYELYQWDLNSKDSLAPLIEKINSFRHREKALQSNRNFRFHPVDNENLIAYSKSDGNDHIVVVVNLDGETKQSGLLELPLFDWNLTEQDTFVMHDLLTDQLFSWKGWRNFIELHPALPAHIFKIKTPDKVKKAANDNKRV
jgi:Glycosidases